ncbi:uncharacterized protein LOC106656555 isoform X2 [Trichogramma pretiosum]|uniref:uncharacterized protein LOC106656555 isoform X2 n=1 Tax=Trichogramma pretiosum TaxID=7493 RepID=UPI000C71A5F9|nr:uncharacterized protein LOC106656555 isoform X2 [Trichogramma pretiosum]
MAGPCFIGWSRISADESHKNYPANFASVIVHLLRNATENYRDTHGFTYFHGACTIGDVEQVARFVDRLGANVNLDGYALSPLYLAVEYRRKDAVRYLLSRGANPNWCDRLGDSSVLHGLARLRRCDCPGSYRPVEATQASAVDEIVDLLVAHGARIDAQNLRGQTPLEWAVSRLDYDTTRALLRHGARPNNLNENLSLSVSDYTEHELSYLPVVLYVPEMINLLSMHGVEINVNTRLKFLKFWMTARKHEMDDTRKLVSKKKDAHTWIVRAEKDLKTKEYRLKLRNTHGFFIGEKDGKRLEYEVERLKREVRLNPNSDEPRPEDIVRTLGGIWVKGDTSLLQICQMSYRQASLILKNLRGWRLPHLGDEPIARDVVKRHIANVLMRPQLELFATDTFMKDDCPRSLSYLSNDQIFRLIDDEELVLKCENQIRLREDQTRLREDQTRLREDQTRLREDQTRLCKQTIEKQAIIFICLSFYIFVISLIIGITFSYINN